MSADVLRGVFHDAKTADVGVALRVVRAVVNVVRAVIRWVRQTICGLTGHDYFIKAADNRIFLRCADCDHETPGWSVEVRRPSGPSASADAVRSRPASDTSGRARASDEVMSQAHDLRRLDGQTRAGTARTAI